MKLMPLIASLGLLAAVACGKDSGVVREAWNAVNDPLRLSGNYSRKLAQLPQEAALQLKPWSDTYWPSKLGGIAVRWAAESNLDDSPFTYRTFTLNELRRMSSGELRALSPAEKYDIANGRYDYPTVLSERARTSPNAASWEGLCHGWAPASYLFEEPKPFTFENSDGIRIPFGSSDVKALLTLYQGNISNAPVRLLGSRCNANTSTNPADRNRPECRDTNAGAFHVVVTNQIGILKKSFVGDVIYDEEVWNQPIHSYAYQIVAYQSPSPGAASGTVREAVIQATMGYSAEIAPNFNPTNNTLAHADGRKVYQYRLELDANDEIIGGEWISEDRPDFLWTQEKATFSGYWKLLESLYERSLGEGQPTPVETPDPVFPSPAPTPTVVPTTGPVPTAVPTGVPTVFPPRPDTDPTPLPTASPGVPWPPVNPIYEKDPLVNPWPASCPEGAVLDKDTRYCREGNLLMGPFTSALINLCVDHFTQLSQSVEPCYADRINKDFLMSIDPRRKQFKK